MHSRFSRRRCRVFASTTTAAYRFIYRKRRIEIKERESVPRKSHCLAPRFALPGGVLKILYSIVSARLRFEGGGGARARADRRTWVSRRLHFTPACWNLSPLSRGGICKYKQFVSEREQSNLPLFRKNVPTYTSHIVKTRRQPCRKIGSNVFGGRPFERKWRARIYYRGRSHPQRDQIVP